MLRMLSYIDGMRPGGRRNVDKYYCVLPIRGRLTLRRLTNPSRERQRSTRPLLSMSLSLYFTVSFKDILVI